MSLPTDEELRRLRAWRERRERAPREPGEPGAAELAEILSHAYETWLCQRDKVRIQPPSGDDLTPEATHRQGVPLLDKRRFPIDLAVAREIFTGLTEVLAARNGALGAAARRVREDDLASRLDHLARAFLGDDPVPFEAFAEAFPETPGLLRFLVHASLSPSLEAVSLKLTPPFAPDANWPHGHCPTCGGAPFMSSLRDKEGHRLLHCSTCRAEWRAPRVACPFCGETDNARLPLFQADEAPGFRIDACESCRRYVKTADFRALDRDNLPLMDDLESAALDAWASGNGWVRPTLSGFGI